MSQIRKEKTKKGSHYRAVVRAKGYYKSQTFASKDDAIIWANDLENQIKKGQYTPIKDNNVILITKVKELIIYFRDNEAPKRYKKPEQYNCMYNWWIDKIGDLNIVDVNANVLTRCKNILLSEPPDKPYKGHTTKSNSTVRKYMFCLSAVFRYAVRNLQILQVNPMSITDKPRKTKGVVRFLSPDERGKLLETANQESDMIYLFAILAIFSGGRYTEIWTLTVENIDFENEMLHYIETKNGEPRGVPVFHKVMEKIREYLNKYNITSGYVFINTKKKKQKLAYIKGAFESVIEKAGIENFRIHDCRHTYASYLAQNGATLLEIAQLMGHKNLQQVQIYAHLTKKHTAKVVRKMSANVWDFE